MTNKSLRISGFAGAAMLVTLALFSFTLQQEPWRIDQLLNPGELAATIKDKKAAQPVIISVGPGAIIPGSLEAGPAVEPMNLKKLETQLAGLAKDADIVIYCGCCPFNRCPNVRPAFSLLNKNGFKNHKLLNLPQNIKTDWIDRGYPVTE